jgi:hypothetical protein
MQSSDEYAGQLSAIRQSILHDIETYYEVIPKVERLVFTESWSLTAPQLDGVECAMAHEFTCVDNKDYYIIDHELNHEFKIDSLDVENLITLLSKLEKKEYTVEEHDGTIDWSGTGYDDSEY